MVIMYSITFHYQKVKQACVHNIYVKHLDLWKMVNGNRQDFRYGHHIHVIDIYK